MMDYVSHQNHSRKVEVTTYGTGATIWPAALVLCKYMEKHPHLVKHKRVMDLGSGTAVSSIPAQY
jgi:predicted nicotinamide N-methyase